MRAKGKQVKAVAERHFVLQEISSTCTILKEFPVICKEMDGYVQSCSVGADCWCQTVRDTDNQWKMPWNGKATYKRIHQHLEKV